MTTRPLFDSSEHPDTGDPSVWQVEIPKRRWSFSVAAGMTALVGEHQPDAQLVVNQASGWWGALTRLGLLRTVAQLPDVVDGEVVHGITVSETLWSDRALVTLPSPDAHIALATGIQAYRQAQ